MGVPSEMPKKSKLSKVTDKRKIKEEEEKQEVASQLPEPNGYRILIAVPSPEDKTSGGIYKTESELHTEPIATVVGFVLKMGED